MHLIVYRICSTTTNMIHVLFQPQHASMHVA